MKKIFYSVLFCILLVACKTYTLSPDSLKNQLIHAASELMEERKVNNPLTNNVFNIKYKANNIKSIKVTDKNGQEVVL